MERDDLTVNQASSMAGSTADRVRSRRAERRMAGGVTSKVTPRERWTSRTGPGVREVGTGLVERAQHGDHDAFESLVRPEIKRLYGLAGLLAGDALAEDAVQEALLRAWRDLPRLRDPAKFGAWLRRLVVNACHDEGRKLRRRRGDVALAWQHDQAAGDELRTVLDRDEMRRAFGLLKTGERTVLALRYYLDLSSAAAAATLGIGELTYRSRVHRAVRALHALLAAEARTTAADAETGFGGMT